MKYIFIVNPASGKYSVQELEERIQTVFGQYDYLIKETRKPGDAQAYTQEYAKSGLDLCFFACGGDGTLHEVVNGLYRYPNAKLAIYPLGTGNDFIKSFQGEYSEHDFLDLKRYLHPLLKPCDLLKCNDFVTINTLSAGFDVKIAKNVDLFKGYFFSKGVIPYFMATLYSFTSNINNEYTIFLDGQKVDRHEFSFVVACNGHYYGGGYNPSPNASVDDGYIDACLINKVTRGQIVRLSGAYKKGELAKYPELSSLYHVKTMQILSKEPVALNVDGEVVSVNNPYIEILPHQITLCLPSKKD